MTPREVMALERRYPADRDDGRKAAAIRAELGVSTTRYAQRLNALLDDPAFIRLDPALARIIRDRRDRRTRGRRVTNAA